jgi:condensin complex subunit 1
MVLTHLIMGDMIKATQLSELAMCLEDTDARIADLARLFFHELSCKGVLAGMGVDFDFDFFYIHK